MENENCPTSSKDNFNLFKGNQELTERYKSFMLDSFDTNAMEDTPEFGDPIELPGELRDRTMQHAHFGDTLMQCDQIIQPELRMQLPNINEVRYWNEINLLFIGISEIHVYTL